jgi:hypothetical protein
MENKLTKEQQSEIFKKHLEGYLKKSNRQVYDVSVNQVDSIKIDGISREVKRKVLKKMKTTETDTELDINKEEKIANLTSDEIEFIKDLYRDNEKIYKLLNRGDTLALKKEDDEEVLSVRKRLSDIQKLENQKGVLVKINKDLYKQMRIFGRSMGLSIREIIHIGMKDMMEKMD